MGSVLSDGDCAVMGAAFRGVKRVFDKLHNALIECGPEGTTRDVFHTELDGFERQCKDLARCANELTYVVGELRFRREQEAKLRVREEYREVHRKLAALRAVKEHLDRLADVSEAFLEYRDACKNNHHQED